MNERARFKKLKCCVIIPTYNNEKTLSAVIDGVLQYTHNVLVVNDGATDSTPEILEKYKDSVDIITHGKNQGKGMALRNGFNHVYLKGYDYAITIDSDGQHYPEDLPGFLDHIESNPDHLIIGARNMAHENVPGKSSFGNKFSNFWFYVDTGIKLSDTQSGYRLYPVKLVKGLSFITTKFEFEIEVIVKAAWRGIPVKNIPVKVHYDPGSERVSHFRPFKDFTRISILNTWFFILAVAYYIPLRFIKSLTRQNIKSFVQKHLFNKEEPVKTKALSIGFGVFMGIFPIWGYQMIVGLAITHMLKLNKALFVVAANISVPPMIPVIIYGSYRLGALLVAHPKNDIFFHNELSIEAIKDNLIQYITGAIALASCAGLLAALLTWLYFFFKRPLNAPPQSFAHDQEKTG